MIVAVQGHLKANLVYLSGEVYLALESAVIFWCGR